MLLPAMQQWVPVLVGDCEVHRNTRYKNLFFYVCVQSQTVHALAQGQKIKDSPNLLTDPKILVHEKMSLPGSTRTQIPLHSLVLTCMTSFAELAFSNALRFPKTQDQGKSKIAWVYKQSLIPWYPDTTVTLIFIYMPLSISRGGGVGFFFFFFK